jgi:hypothetical protein
MTIPVINTEKLELFSMGYIEDDDDLEREVIEDDMNTSVVSGVSSMNQTVIEFDPEDVP